jgi:hypothetical protein
MGAWLNIIGKERDHDRDHEGRGEYDRDRWQQQPWQQQPWQQQPWQQPWWQQQQPWYGQQQAPGGFQWAPGYGGTPGHWERQRAWTRGIVGALPWYSVVGAELGNGAISPRNALIEVPSPEHAGREVLPMSTGVAILPTQSAQITARPQRVAFRPERVFISAAGTSGGAADWVVNDIKIGNRSQFSQSGDVPGDMFATNAIDGFVSFETAQTAMDVVMVVTYIGLNESGVPFFASIVGTAAI